MNEIDILPRFRGTLIHDHWKPYYTYQQCQHGLCNAHHIRELQWVIDNHAQYTWAKSMQDLLLEINEAVNKTKKNCLDNATADYSEPIESDHFFNFFSYRSCPQANRLGATFKLAYRPVGPVVNFFLN